MPTWPRYTPTRRQAITLALYALALTAIVGGRGWFLASALGGRYLLSSLLFDAAGLAAMVALLRLFDHAEYRERLRRFVEGATS